ncbi:TraB/GumN family protein [Flavobacterium sp. MFBS3-15]|uniref:TraB/GumN family protein n=1 Tax=Flavobacterium sp. MFBS3-15 TaxID=2989816 RepID=UPI002236BD25|nr:TraB/GumN family protein [Flavobacterium sp. MFBS3-15]MCW4468484.1 TraB/GumN family protein [Flavobacterium sp. MFBS3-15]
MKNLLIITLSLISLFANAQKLDKGLLWKISGNGLSSPSYLYGTMHIVCDNTLEASTLKALDNTKQLYLEMDMDDPSIPLKMMSGMVMKDGKTMTSMSSPEDLKVVDEYLVKNTGMGVKMMDKFKPSMAGMMVMPKMVDCPIKSVEEALMKVTKEQNEQTYGLETLDEQMAVFDAISYEEQMKELIKSAKEGTEKGRAMFKKMLDLYNAKDLNALMDFMNDEENKFYGDNTDVLLDQRNANWISKIEEAAKKTPTFFGVGAAHLGGENGVIALLRKKGYKVEAVK